MAFAMIDDLTGDHHPVDAAHRLALVLDPDGDHDGTIAVWDVASTDPRELLTQLGEHLSGVAAPLQPDPGPLPGSEQLEATLRRIGGHEVDDKLDHARTAPSNGQATPDVAAPAAARPAVPGPRRATAPERVAEAVGGAATDAVVRAWAARHNVPCSMTGKLNGWARSAYLRVKGGEPDEEMWRDAGLPLAFAPKPSPSASAADDEKPAAAPVPPAGTAAGTPTPDRAGRGPDGPPAPASLGEDGSGAGATDDHVRPEQQDLAEEMAADGATPRRIVEKTGVPLEVARELFASAKGGRR